MLQSPFHSTTKPNGVPNLNYGSLWYDESTQLLYAGYTGTSSSFDVDSDPLPPSESIWTFKPDNLGSGIWNLTIPSSASVWKTTTRTDGGYQAYGNGSAYVLGGVNYPLTGNYLYPGMIRFDMSSQVFSNISSEIGATSPSVKPCWFGAMHYVPSFSSNGIFVVMGGKDSNDFIDFGYIQVFDPASGSWYNQTTTGSKPASRVVFCTAGAASTNNTYEIFVYAGYSGEIGPSSLPLDTVNILSLPAFNWFSVAYNPQNPRTRHTCEGVGGSQIAIIGGYDANSKVTTGSGNDIIRSEFSTPDPFAQGLAIFDLRTLDFAAECIAGGGAVYEPNDVITQFYAQGSYSGNLAEGLAQLMNDTHFPPPTSSKSTPSNSNFTPPSSFSNSPHTNHAGAIAGGIIGGLGIALIIALVIWLLRRRRRKMQAQLSRTPALDGAVYGNQPWVHDTDGNTRAELPQPVTTLELGYGEAHELDQTGHPQGDLPD